MKNKENWLLVGLSGILVILLGVSLRFMWVNAHSENDVKASEQKVAKAEKNYTKKHKVIKQKYNVYVSENGDGKSKQVGENNIARNVLYDNADHFFKVYYDYKNGSEYAQRKDKLVNLVTPEIANNQNIFNSNSQVIDTTGAQSRYEGIKVYVSKADNRTVNGLVIANYDFGYSSDNMNSGSQLYNVTFDRQTGKLTTIELLNLSDKK